MQTQIVSRLCVVRVERIVDFVLFSLQTGNSDLSDNDSESSVLYRLDNGSSGFDEDSSDDNNSTYLINDDEIKRNTNIKTSSKRNRKRSSSLTENHVDKKLKFKHEYEFEELHLGNDKLTCIVPGCDSQGNLNGIDDTHYTISNCPLYHNMTFEQCQEMYKKRSKLKLNHQANSSKSSPKSSKNKQSNLVNGDHSKSPKKANSTNKDPYSKLITVSYQILK